MASKNPFYSTLYSAIRDISDNGADQPDRIAYWQRLLREALDRTLAPDHEMRRLVRDGLVALYKRLVDRGAVLRRHPGVTRFDIERIRPELRMELDRRIMFSADLVSLRRDEVIPATMRRFAGWVSSIPAQGSDKVKKRKEAERLRREVSNVGYEARRVLIDQGHKLTSAINQTIADQGGAIAARWHSHWHEANYDYREDHKERELESRKLPYLIRDSWAMKEGLLQLAGSKYTDQMTQPAEEPFCRCFYEFVYSLKQMPQSMLTTKGREWLARGQRLRKAIAA